MPRISMQQAYDNKDVITQIYKMMAEVADALETATDAVSKALEAIGAAEDAGEAAEAAQQTADGKQDALTAEQLLAVNSGITAEGVTQIGTNATAIEGLDDRTEILVSTAEASAGDALILDENKAPAWEALKRIIEPHTFSTFGELATAILDKGIENMIIQYKRPSTTVSMNLYTSNDSVYVLLDYANKLDANTAYFGAGTFNFFKTTVATTQTVNCTVKSIRGNTTDNTLTVETTTPNYTIRAADIILWY